MGSGRHRDWVIGYLLGFVLPPLKTLRRIWTGREGGIFILTFEKWQLMASHDNIFIIFIAKNGMIFYDLSM